MSVSKEKVAAILQYFATLFPLDLALHADKDVFIAVWHSILKDEDEELLIKACGNLLRTLKRFPFPADVLEEMAAIRAACPQPEIADSKAGGV